MQYRYHKIDPVTICIYSDDKNVSTTKTIPQKSKYLFNTVRHVYRLSNRNS